MLATTCGANTYYVSADGDGGDGQSWGHAETTIAAAIADVPVGTGHIIEVNSGSFAACELTQANSGDKGFMIQPAAGDTVTITKLTNTGFRCSAAADFGGGDEDLTTVVFKNLIFDCTGCAWGAFQWQGNKKITVENCTFTNTSGVTSTSVFLANSNGLAAGVPSSRVITLINTDITTPTNGFNCISVNNGSLVIENCNLDASASAATGTQGYAIVYTTTANQGYGGNVTITDSNLTGSTAGDGGINFPAVTDNTASTTLTIEDTDITYKQYGIFIQDDMVLTCKINGGTFTGSSTTEYATGLYYIYTAPANLVINDAAFTDCARCICIPLGVVDKAYITNNSFITNYDFSDNYLTASFAVYFGTAYTTTSSSSFLFENNIVNSSGAGVFIGESQWGAKILNNEITAENNALRSDARYPVIQGNIISGGGSALQVWGGVGGYVEHNTVFMKKLTYTGHGNAFLYGKQLSSITEPTGIVIRNNIFDATDPYVGVRGIKIWEHANGIKSISGDGATVTVDCLLSQHGLLTDADVTISGCGDYDGKNIKITVTDANSFTYSSAVTDVCTPTSSSTVSTCKHYDAQINYNYYTTGGEPEGSHSCALFSKLGGDAAEGSAYDLRQLQLLWADPNNLWWEPGLIDVSENDANSMVGTNPGFIDSANGDFSLDPNSVNINTGKPTLNGGYTDIGAWQRKSLLLREYAPAGDLNEDHIVDFYDFAVMASNWLIDCLTDPNNPACISE